MSAEKALPVRLAAALEAVGACGTLLDIGCDHGLLAVRAVKSGLCERAIASDVSPLALSRAARRVSREQLEDRIDCRLADGFGAVSPGEADRAVAAGIGGLTLAQILARGGDAAHALERIVFVPSCDAESLRGALRENGWNVFEERLVKEAGRIYPVMSARPGADESPGGVYDLIGYAPCRRRDPLAMELAEKKRAAARRALYGAARACGRESSAARALRRRVQALDDLLGRMSGP